MNKETGYFKNKYSNVRRAVVVVGVLIIMLLMVTLCLSMLSATHMKKIISEDFNQQQLVLAKYAASCMEHCLDFIGNELLLLNLSPAIQYLEEISWGSRMHRTLSAVKDEGVLEIRLIEDGGKTAYVVDRRGIPRIVRGYFRDTEYFKWASLKENKHRIYVSEITREDKHYPGQLVMIVATPTYEESVDASYPVPTGRFAGVLLFTLDATQLVKHAIKDIKSGKTGYVWVIDRSGVFLYHPQRDFIGEDAFKVRAAKNPEISFDEINRIQKEKMLKGEEGTGSYVSGWHRDIEGEIEKLIAHAPVHLNLDPPPVKWFWSVAVVAPMSEVEGTIHSVYIRQFYLQSIISLIIILGGVYIISYERRWGKTLEVEVITKTKDLKKSLDELKKSEEKYKTLIESAEDLIFTVDEDGKFLSLNRCAANFLRGREEDLIGKRICDLFSAKSAELQMDFIIQVFNTGRNINVKYPVEIGKREYWFTSNFVALKDERGEVFAALGISRDITERKKLEEEQMYNTEKLASLGKLAAGVAHEINTAVGIIAGFTDLVLEKIDPASKNHEILETIERQALNCKRIVENILGFARYPEIIEYDADVNLNLERVIAVVEHILVTKKITLVKHLAEDLPKVRGDSGHLQQVFMNLITNAFGAMEGGGVLTVTTRRNIPGDKVEILFKDTGHGIKREYRDKIFDPFFTTKKVEEGTGLGLSVSYGIVTKYDGDITFETVAEAEDRERKGTTFTVSLPVAPKPKAL